MAKKNKGFMEFTGQDVVTLACFDKVAAGQIFASISARHLPNEHLREVFSRAKDYYEKYSDVIGTHLTNEFEAELTDRKQRGRSAAYQDLIEGIMENSESVNVDYLQDKMQDFLLRQQAKAAIPDLVESVQEGSMEELSEKIQKLASVRPMEQFEFLDADNTDELFERIDNPRQEEFITLGIPDFDNNELRPTKGRLLVMAAPSKRGKSWFALHCAKRATQLRRWRTLIVTLEMPNVDYQERLLRTISGVSKRTEILPSTVIVTKGSDGSYDHLDFIEDYEIKGYEDCPEAEKKYRAAKEWLADRKSKGAIKLMQYKTAALTFSKLEAAIDHLERVEGFVPDQLIFDYPGIMKLDSNNMRHEISEVFQKLHGLGQERDMAVVAFHQTNAAALNEADADNDSNELSLSEAKSIAHIVDGLIIYNQSAKDKAIGVARLYASNSRHGRDKFAVLVSQNYASGQFCLTSAERCPQYFEDRNLLLDDYDAEQSESDTRERAGGSGPDGFVRTEDGSWINKDTGEVFEGRSNGFIK